MWTSGWKKSEVNTMGRRLKQTLFPSLYLEIIQSANYKIPRIVIESQVYDDMSTS